MISTIEQILDKIPRHFSKGGEWGGPCPFCTQPSDKITFTGDDRLVIFGDGRGMYCRYCAKEGRGRNGGGYYSTRQFAALFDETISQDFSSEYTPQERPLHSLWDAKQVQAAHARVIRKYWYEFGWDDAVIDRFLLGEGVLYPNDPRGHLLPMEGLINTIDDTSLGLFYMAYRGEQGEEKLKKRSPGRSKPYLWVVQDDPSSGVMALIEGEKDGPTAWLAGYKNFAVTFGSRTWVKDKARYLAEDLGYKKFVILRDQDDAGLALATEAARDLSYYGTSVEILMTATSYDLTEKNSILQGANELRQWIDSHLVLYEAPTAPIMNQNSNHQNREIIPLDTLRGLGPKSLRFRINQYLDDFKRGDLLHLAAPPGVGKTHALVEASEKIARQSLVEYHSRLDFFQRQLDHINFRIQHDDLMMFDKMQAYDERKRMQDKLERHSSTSVAFLGQFKHGWDDLLDQGIDQSLWFNFQARNDDNCQNFKFVSRLGENHHHIGVFCRTNCPFFQSCNETGYLAQDEQRQKKPITYYRHGHLVGNRLESDYKKLVVVDEYSGSVLENAPISFEIEDIHPFHDDWDFDIESTAEYVAVEQLTASLKIVLTHSTGDADSILSGATFLRRLDQVIKTTYETRLSTILDRIHPDAIHKNYQPNYRGGSDDLVEVHNRCIPQFYDVLMRELPDYREDGQNKHPSCLHLQDGTMEVYASRTIKTRKSTPLIISDATGIPDIYRALFSRQQKHMQIYAPMIKNDNAEIIVAQGSDWTKTQIEWEIGSALKERKQLQDALTTVKSLDGKITSQSDIPVSENIYGSSIIKQAATVVRGIAKEHESLLVVTHKNIRELLESIAGGGRVGEEFTRLTKHKQIAFSHYGALRGTNAYQDFEAVVLIGAFRIPYPALWKRIQMWANLLNIKDAIPYQLETRERAYDTQDTEAEFGYYHTFNHPFADAIVDMVEMGEMQQCLNRIRPHNTDKKKKIFVFANRPAAQFVTSVLQKDDLLVQWGYGKLSEMKSWIEEIKESTGKFPTYDRTIAKFNVSRRDISKIRKELSA